MSEAQKARLLSALSRNSGDRTDFCTDPIVNYGNKKYKLVLEYAIKVVYDQEISTDILTIDIDRWQSGVFTYVIDHNSLISQGKFVKIN